jgi:hypothetical protein
MRSLLLLLCSPLVATVIVWTSLVACVDAPPAGPPPVARLVAAWDPLACGEPHRVVIELEDEYGARAATSAPCNLGGLTLDVAHFGSYHGRIYAWALDASVRSVVPIDVVIDQPIIHWSVATPP